MQKDWEAIKPKPLNRWWQANRLSPVLVLPLPSGACQLEYLSVWQKQRNILRQKQHNTIRSQSRIAEADASLITAGVWDRSKSCIDKKFERVRKSTFFIGGIFRYSTLNSQCSMERPMITGYFNRIKYAFLRLFPQWDQENGAGDSCAWSWF